MSGIVGIISSNKQEQQKVGLAIRSLATKKEKSYDEIIIGKVALAQTHPSEKTSNTNKPYSDYSKRYSVAFNGIIYNRSALKKELLNDGVSLTSNTDAQLLLLCYIQYQKECLDKINGAFAFAIYDKQEKSLLIARDKLGVKPLVYYCDNERFVFCSTLKGLLKFNINKQIDKTSLFHYLQFNYIPTNSSMLLGVKKLKPGHFIHINNAENLEEEITEKMYYEIPFTPAPTIQTSALNYDKAQEMLHNLLDDAMQQRMDSSRSASVFLDGTISAYLINLMAKKHSTDLISYSLQLEGFSDKPTQNTIEIAKKIGGKHHIFSVSNNDLHQNLENLLDYYDEPFADLSAISLYLLSQQTKQHVPTTMLTGIGAAEMFAGDNKHIAEFKSRHAGIKESVIKMGHPLWQNLPKNRSSIVTNITRKLYRFSAGSKLSNKMRYWEWTSLINEERANYLLKEELVFNPQRLSDTAYGYKKQKEELLKHIRKDGDMNDVLYTDMSVVLSHNILRKMATITAQESIELNAPFLDHRLVSFAFSLPVAFKINPNNSMKILHDTFQAYLPREAFEPATPKFEVPLLSWMRNEFRTSIEDDLLSDQFIEAQGLFNVSAIQSLKKELFSNHPQGVEATIWALLVFNKWWKKHFELF